MKCTVSDITSKMNPRSTYLLSCCFCQRHFSTSITAAAANHYTSLGLSSKATQTEVKSAYYNLSKIYHPDKNQGSVEASNRFRDITAAYEVLGNMRLRRLYDKGIEVGEGTSATRTTYGYPDDDPATSFYRSREHRSKPPAYGRTPIYDFDEWSRAHYGATFARDMARRKRSAFISEQAAIKRNETKFESLLLVFMLFTVGLLFVTTQDAHDSANFVRPAQSKNNTTISDKAKPQ